MPMMPLAWLTLLAQAPQGNPLGGLVAGGCVLVVLFGFLVALVISLMGTRRQPDLVSRDEFIAAAIGKSAEELIEWMGHPDATTKKGNWYYDGRTFDPATRTTDRRVKVAFKAGKVSRVEY